MHQCSMYLFAPLNVCYCMDICTLWVNAAICEHAHYLLLNAAKQHQAQQACAFGAIINNPCVASRVPKTACNVAVHILHANRRLLQHRRS